MTVDQDDIEKWYDHLKELGETDPEYVYIIGALSDEAIHLFAEAIVKKIQSGIQAGINEKEAIQG